MKLPFFKKKSKKLEPVFEAPTIGIKDIIAPSALTSLKPDHLKLGKRLARSFFILGYRIGYSPLLPQYFVYYSVYII